MIYGEWNMDEALAVRYEEGREEAMEEHKELFALWEKGVSLAEAKKNLEIFCNLPHQRKKRIKGKHNSNI